MHMPVINGPMVYAVTGAAGVRVSSKHEDHGDGCERH
jgi:hypothetical protein